MIRLKLLSEPGVSIALDSGAFSWANFNKKKTGTGFVDCSYINSKEFKQYFNNYLEYVHLFIDELDFYINLDIIGNYKLTRETQKEMEDNGLEPVPVFHVELSPLTEFKRYADKYEIVAISSFSKGNDDYSKLSDIFEYICNSKGRPSVKVHGLAMTGFDTLIKYPFWSVDSSSWASYSRYGGVVFPRVVRAGGKRQYDFLTRLNEFKITDATRHIKSHVDYMPPIIIKELKRYFEFIFRESCWDLVKSDYLYRDAINAVAFTLLSIEIKRHYSERFDFEEGGRIYLGSKPSAGVSLDKIQFVVDKVLGSQKHPKTPFRFFGSYFYKGDMEKVIEACK